MRNNQHRTIDLLAQIFKHIDQVVKAPKVDSCFRLIKDGQFGFSCHNSCDFNSFDLTTGKACIDLTVDIISCAQSNFLQISACFAVADLTSGSQVDQVTNCNSLKANRLLESKADSTGRSLCDVQICNIFSIQKNLSLIWF